jgi:hypothetical protein
LEPISAFQSKPTLPLRARDNGHLDSFSEKSMLNTFVIKDEQYLVEIAPLSSGEYTSDVEIVVMVSERMSERMSDTMASVILMGSLTN